MNDSEFMHNAKRYLERLGEMSGCTLFRTAVRGDVIQPEARPAPASMTGNAHSGKSQPAPRAAPAGTAEKRPVTGSAGRVRKTEPKDQGRGKPGEGSGGEAGPEWKAAPTGQPPPARREYIVKGPVKGTPETAQADLFGGAQAAPAASDLDGLDIAALEKRVSTCTLCPLCEGRNRTVFGSGDPKAKIVFIGEAPGREEDLRGEPFVGRAGQLLTKILASVGFTREEVYITNILKCRPPENRDPNEKEVRACKPYLRRQIALLEPVLICALGRIAGQNLLERNASLSVLRQHIHYYEDVRTIVTYHPAALLRNPNLKRAAWEDIQETRRIYDEALKER
jgi:uracil-DNA glycosylase family 4